MHGSTKGKRVFSELGDLKSIRTYQHMDRNGKIHYAADKSSISNGTQFSEINGRELKDP